MDGASFSRPASVALRLWPGLLAGAAALSGGCVAVADAAHGLGAGARQTMRELNEQHRNREWAAAAWDQVRQTHPAAASPDYADGFVDGFADHLFRGTTEPPPLPPDRYRSVAKQTQAGYHAGVAWLAGFRHGVEDAQARSARRWVVGPSAATVTPAVVEPAPPAVVVRPERRPDAPPTQVAEPASETSLSLPRANRPATPPLPPTPPLPAAPPPVIFPAAAEPPRADLPGTPTPVPTPPPPPPATLPAAVRPATFLLQAAAPVVAVRPPRKASPAGGPLDWAAESATLEWRPAAR